MYAGSQVDSSESHISGMVHLRQQANTISEVARSIKETLVFPIFQFHLCNTHFSPSTIFFSASSDWAN